MWMCFVIIERATTKLFSLPLPAPFRIYHPRHEAVDRLEVGEPVAVVQVAQDRVRPRDLLVDGRQLERPAHDRGRRAADRKSTRLNSSHANISYAVFCLKKQINFVRFVCS